jgi:hypothetical protein
MPLEKTYRGKLPHAPAGERRLLNDRIAETVKSIRQHYDKRSLAKKKKHQPSGQMHLF